MSWYQRCKVCGQRDKMDFQIKDDVWERVVPPPYQNRVVCLSCFDSFASQRGIKYAHAIEGEICFVGDMAGFHLIIEKINEPVID